MEFIIGLLVLCAVAYFVFRPKKTEEVVVEVAPYKVETPVPEDLADIAIAQRPEPVATEEAKAPVKKKPVAKKAPAKKAAPKAPAKKPVAKKPAAKPVAKKAPAKKKPATK